MSKATIKDAFITVSPVTQRGKWSVFVRRIGSKDRYAFLAETRSEEVADRIVLALSALQGDQEKLEAKMQPVLDDVRRQLASTREQVSALQKDLLEERRAHSATRNSLRSAQVDPERLQREISSLNERINNQALTISEQIATITRLQDQKAPA